MSLWLYSSGDGDDNERVDGHLLARLPQKKARLTFVPTATADAAYFFEEFSERFGRRGYRNLELLALDAPGSPFFTAALDRALKSDLIYLSGGNTFQLLQSLRRSGFDKALKGRAASGGLIAGHSAGAIVLTPDILTASYPESDRDDNDVGLVDLRALRLVDFEVFPHYTSKLSYNTEIQRASLKRGRPIYALPDGSCIAMGAGTITFHGPVWAFVKGVRFRVSWG